MEPARMRFLFLTTTVELTTCNNKILFRIYEKCGQLVWAELSSRGSSEKKKKRDYFVNGFPMKVQSAAGPLADVSCSFYRSAKKKRLALVLFVWCPSAMSQRNGAICFCYATGTNYVAVASSFKNKTIQWARPRPLMDSTERQRGRHCYVSSLESSSAAVTPVT